ncbi:MAG TPA: ABC transporter ATP-binding protein [Gemmataceae bacterium]|jgi:ABC-2 type transport system ATP-binding protein|nr:ABC transporter ATP-binding protein [Gemmataceae bacterium]
MSSFLIDIHHVTRQFGSLTALRDITLQLPPGRIGLLGPNGAGKSTLLKILMGLLEPSSGSGRILDHEIATGQRGAGWQLRQQIGFMPETDALIPGLRGVEYVALAGELYGMPRKQAQRRAHEVLTYLELEDARYRKLEEYSTGMKQRLKLAQAIVHDPPVLLLDEPTSGLDPAGRSAMLRLLLQFGRDFGKSMILSTHLLGDVEQVCEMVVVLFDGEVRAQGSVRELCAQRQDRFRLQLQGEANGFLDSLRLEGVDVVHDNGRGDIRVLAPPTWHTRTFFALADRHGIALRGLERDDETLEELFYRLVGRQTGRTS